MWRSGPLIWAQRAAELQPPGFLLAAPPAREGTSQEEWQALPPLSPGGDYDVRREIAEKLGEPLNMV